MLDLGLVNLKTFLVSFIENSSAKGRDLNFISTNYPLQHLVLVRIVHITKLDPHIVVLIYFQGADEVLGCILLITCPEVKLSHFRKDFGIFFISLLEVRHHLDVDL